MNIIIYETHLHVLANGGQTPISLNETVNMLQRAWGTFLI